MQSARVTRGLLLICSVVAWSGCASRPTIEKLPVRRVGYGETPEFKPLAERARQIGNEVYPKLTALLNEDATAAPEQFDIVFKRRLPGNNQGSTIGATI